MAAPADEGLAGAWGAGEGTPWTTGAEAVARQGLNSQAEQALLAAPPPLAVSCATTVSTPVAGTVSVAVTAVPTVAACSRRVTAPTPAPAPAPAPSPRSWRWREKTQPVAGLKVLKDALASSGSCSLVATSTSWLRMTVVPAGSGCGDAAAAMTPQRTADAQPELAAAAASPDGGT